jgi:hypothetical protein
MSETGEGRQRRTIVYDGLEYELLDSHAMRAPEGRYRVLNRVVDTLYLRTWNPFRMSEWFEEQLDSWRTIVRTWRKEPEVVMIPGLGHFELTRGGENYEFALWNERVAKIRVMWPDAWHKKGVAQTGQFYIEFRSGFLQFVGIPGALKFVDALERTMLSNQPILAANMPERYRIISRVDVSVDYEMPEKMTWQTTDEYVARAPRMKKDAWLSPFGDDTETVFSRLLAESKKKLRQYQKNKGVSDTNSRSEITRGVYSSQVNVSSFSGEAAASQTETVLHAPDAENDPGAPLELALASAFSQFVKFAEEQIGYGDAAVLNRVIGTAQQLQTLYFGRFGSPIYAREYNKTLESTVSDKAYLIDVWSKNGWTLETPVWRLEFSLATDALRSWPAKPDQENSGEFINVADPLEFLERIPDVWNYLTRTWLRHCVPSATEPNRSRWEPSERWKVLQSAWGDVSRIERVPKLPKPNPEITRKVGRGYLVSTTASTAHLTDDVPALLDSSAEARAKARETNLKAAQTAFREHIEYLMTWSDTHEFWPTLRDSRRRKGMGLDWLLELDTGETHARAIARRIEQARERFKSELRTALEWSETDEFFHALLEKRKRKGLDATTEHRLSLLATSGARDVANKALEAELDAFNDTEFSRLARREQMRKGRGS